MRKKKLFTELHKELYAAGLTYAEIAAALDKSEAYVGDRFRGLRSWPIDLAYRILDLLNLPKNMVFDYFPPNGRQEQWEVHQ